MQAPETAKQRAFRRQTILVAMLFVLHGTGLLSADEGEALLHTAPVEASDVGSTFSLQDGFSLQLVAAEPNVTDPVAGAFDEDGRLYIVEMNDYPYTDKSTDKPNVERTADLPLGKVRLLEDTDDDGVFDRSLIFARDLSWPTGIAVFRGGVFVAATPDIWYLRDEDGDGEAEIRQRIFTGFRKLNVQAVVNNLIWGLDHRIYGAGGTNGGKVSSQADETNSVLTFARNDFCFTPDNPQMELLSGGARFGNAFDDWGNRFICNIRNPIQHVVLPRRFMIRNPALNFGSPMNDVALSGDQIPVFRSSPPEPWRVINAARLTSQGDPRMPRSEKNAQGFMTSACGVTVYRGDAYPPEFRQQVLLADVAGNLIHRQKLEPSGVTFTSQRMDDHSEFVASTDNWFRPVNFVHAPDGTLYVLDMYRETIEHPWSMPDDLKALLDLENGRDRGRIYRMAPPRFRRRQTPRLSQATTADLVRLLQHPNAWHRETAHRLLFERQDSESVTLLRQTLRDSSSDLGRLHAFWTLEGMNQLTEEDLLALLNDSASGIREHAVLLAEKRTAESSSLALRSEIIRLADDVSDRVRFQVAFALGQFDDPRCSAALESIVRRDANDPWIINAALSSSGVLAPRLFEKLLQEQEFLTDPVFLPVLKQLATVTGVRKSPEELAAIGRGIESLPTKLRLSPVTTELLLAMDDGLHLAGSRLSAIWQDKGARTVLSEQIAAALVVISDSRQSTETRMTALRLVACSDLVTVRAAMTPLLTTQQPPEIQTAAVRTLATFQDEHTAAELVSVFAASTPTVQYEIIESLANHPQRIQVLLDTIEQGKIAAAQVTPIRRTLLLNHADEPIRRRAQKLLAMDRETPRKQVLEQYQEALTLAGDGQRGKLLFGRECSTCHRFGDSGFDVGPSLITVRHRSPSELLTQILDPNREVGPNYMQFAVVLNDGLVLAGMIAEESPASLTLKRAENKQDVVLRQNITEIKATGLSLMPEGFEKKFSTQEMADLIAFLRAY